METNKISDANTGLHTSLTTGINEQILNVRAWTRYYKPSTG